MKDNFIFSKNAQKNLVKIEKKISTPNAISLFYNRLANNICTILRENKLKHNVNHRANFREKAIPEISLIELTFSFRTENLLTTMEVHSISVK